MADISANVVILTKDEYEARRREAYQKGVRRGEFESGSKYCRGGSDGECSWFLCPQKWSGEPEKSGRHCPLDQHREDF